jgi:hypothetical protein
MKKHKAFQAVTTDAYILTDSSNKSIYYIKQKKVRLETIVLRMRVNRFYLGTFSLFYILFQYTIFS